MMMTRYAAALAVCLAATAASAAELTAGSGHSVRLSPYGGTVYYTVAEDGFEVVVTLASGPEATPIRFVSTLRPGQRMLISVPRAVGEPSADFDIVRNGDVLVASDPVVAATAEPPGIDPTWATLAE